MFGKYIDIPFPNADNWVKYVGAVTGTVTVASGCVILWKRYQERNLPPGPRGGIFSGVTGGVLNEDNPDYDDFIKLWKEHGDIFSTTLGNKLSIFLASHSAIKEAFVQQAETFALRPTDSQGLVYFNGLQDDIFAAPYTKERWNQNKAEILGCMRGAGFGQSKTTEEKILEQVELLVEYFERLSKDKKPIQLRDVVPKATLNFIFRIMLTKHFDYEDPKLGETLQILREFLLTFNEDMLLLAGVPAIVARILYPKTVAKVREKADNIRKIIRKEVDEHIENFDPDNPRDYVDNYLLKRGKDDIPRLVDNVLVFLPDASDSLAEGVIWVLLYLIYHQDVKKRVVAEIEQVTGGNRHVMWSDKEKMPLTEATIREVLRLCVPVPMTVAHAADKDTTLRGFRIPKTAQVFGLLYTANRDPAVFKDPDTFNPDRFLDANGKVVKNDTWIPFGMGRRKCPGEQIAQIELFLIAANLMQRFDFQFPEGEDVTLEAEPTFFLRCSKSFHVLINNKTK